MNYEKAEKCKTCNTDKYLQWKTFNSEKWWIHCDECGQTGPIGDTQTEAGEKWNKKQLEKIPSNS